MRVYIAGGIFGKPNYVADFAAAELALTEAGHEAVNPLDIYPHEHTGPCPTTYKGGQDDHDAACYMRTDLLALMDCDAIHMLEGWETSRGATTEHMVAKALGLPVITLEEAS